MNSYLGEDKKKWIMVLFFIVMGFLSYFVIADSEWLNSLTSDIIASLDRKKEMVVSLTAASTTASFAITAIPGEVGVPIAENLADLSDYFLIVFGAIWLQKYLVGITGFITFKLIVPTVCGLLITNAFLSKKQFVVIAKKLIVFGLVFFSLIPTSVAISNHIETTYRDSVEQTIKKAEKDSKKANSSNLIEKLGISIKQKIKSLKQILSNMIDAVAVLIITTCIIPVLVVLFFLWTIKLLFNLDFSPRVPKLHLIRKSQKRYRRYRTSKN